MTHLLPPHRAQINALRRLVEKETQLPKEVLSPDALTFAWSKLHEEIDITPELIKRQTESTDWTDPEAVGHLIAAQLQVAEVSTSGNDLIL